MNQNGLVKTVRRGGGDHWFSSLRFTYTFIHNSRISTPFTRNFVFNNKLYINIETKSRTEAYYAVLSKRRS